jgi:DNA modification methylase
MAKIPTPSQRSPVGPPGGRAASPASPPYAWRSRVVGHDEISPAELVANPLNWRLHPRGQQQAMAAVLTDIGWVDDVIVNRTTGHIVDGHLRVELALARHEPTVPVTYVELSEAEERTILATFDPIGAMAHGDKERLAQLIGELAPSDPAIEAVVADLARANGLALRMGLTDPDALPPLPDPAEVYVQSGDLWGLGAHRLLCGDATRPADVERLLAGAEPTLLSTDPPYGVSLDPTWRDGVYNALGPAAQPYMRIAATPEGEDATRAPRGAHGRTAGHRNTTLSGDTRVDWSEAFALVPSLRVGYVWHAGVHAPAVAAGLERIGFAIVAQIIWDKGLFAMGRSWYHWSHEPCWVVRKAGASVPFHGPRNQATIWRAPSPKMIMAGSTEEKFDHPAQKPVLLSETPIANHLARGAAVYDPFLGSGTTLIAAERLGRVCYALELEPRYVQICIERWQAFTGQQAVRLDG